MRDHDLLQERRMMFRLGHVQIHRPDDAELATLLPATNGAGI
jgi:hypothetical protein